MRTLLIALLFLPTVALAQSAPTVVPPSNEPAPSAQQLAEARVLQTFIDESAVPCQTRPAKECVDLGWRYAAAKPRDGLTVDDLQKLRTQLGSWFEVNKALLPARTRASFALGLMLADGMGMERLHAGFDTNHDGKVSQQELLADVKMDNRPLGQVLADPAAVDRAGVARRLGLPPALTDGLFRAGTQSAQQPAR
ncbi:MAG: hypothetical protein ACM30I_09655 [Gemmatimonas sp.]